jgi:hypothetical protein
VTGGLFGRETLAPARTAATKGGGAGGFAGRGAFSGRRPDFCVHVVGISQDSGIDRQAILDRPRYRGPKQDCFRHLRESSCSAHPRRGQGRMLAAKVTRDLAHPPAPSPLVAVVRAAAYAPRPGTSARPGHPWSPQLMPPHTPRDLAQPPGPITPWSPQFVPPRTRKILRASRRQLGVSTRARCSGRRTSRAG